MMIDYKQITLFTRIIDGIQDSSVDNLSRFHPFLLNLNQSPRADHLLILAKMSS
jgi:hypothetical protein